MVSLLVFLFILGILIVVHEFGHFIMAKRVGVRVEQFCLGFGRALFKKKRGDTEYSIASIPLGGFVKLAGDNLEEFKGKPDEYFSKAPGKRFWIIFFGPFLNYVLGFLVFWLILFTGYPTLTTKVGGLLDDFGAKEAGLLAGDRITAIDGKNVAFWEDLLDTVQKKKAGETASLSVKRDDREFKVTVQIKEKKLNDLLGQEKKVGLLGITPSEDIVTVRHGLLASFFLAGEKTWELTTLTFKGLWFMITGQMSMRESVTGPLGIFYITSKAASLGLVAVLHLIAVLSISLGIFNLLPLPILDGGHIVLLGVEKIRGKSISLAAERVISQIGMTMLVFLVIFVTYNDIVRYFGDKIAIFFNK